MTRFSASSSTHAQHVSATAPVYLYPPAYPAQGPSTSHLPPHVVWQTQLFADYEHATSSDCDHASPASTTYAGGPAQHYASDGGRSGRDAYGIAPSHPSAWTQNPSSDARWQLYGTPPVHFAPPLPPRYPSAAGYRPVDRGGGSAASPSPASVPMSRYPAPPDATRYPPPAYPSLDYYGVYEREPPAHLYYQQAQAGQQEIAPRSTFSTGDPRAGLYGFDSRPRQAYFASHPAREPIERRPPSAYSPESPQLGFAPPPTAPLFTSSNPDDRRSSLHSIESSGSASSYALSRVEAYSSRPSTLDATLSPVDVSSCSGFEACSSPRPRTGLDESRSESPFYAPDIDEQRRFSWPMTSALETEYARTLRLAASPSRPFFDPHDEDEDEDDDAEGGRRDPPWIEAYDPDAMTYERAETDEPLSPPSNGGDGRLQHAGAGQDGEGRGRGDGQDRESEEVVGGARALIGINPSSLSHLHEQEDQKTLELALRKTSPVSVETARQGEGKRRSERLSASGTERRNDEQGLSRAVASSAKGKRRRDVSDEEEEGGGPVEPIEDVEGPEEVVGSDDDDEGDEYLPPGAARRSSRSSTPKPFKKGPAEPVASGSKSRQASTSMTTTKSRTKPTLVRKIATQAPATLGRAWESTSAFWAPFELLTEILDSNGTPNEVDTLIQNPSSFTYSPETSSWLTYRRNFMSLDVYVTLPTSTPELSALHTSSSASPIAYFEVTLSSMMYPNGNDVELLQFDSTRSLPKAKTVKPHRLERFEGTRPTFGQQPSLSRARNALSGSLPPPSSNLATTSYSTSFSKVQYRASTSNHPAASPENADWRFVMRAVLTAVHDDGSESTIGMWDSNRLVVRGRSPGCFGQQATTKKKKKKEAQSAKAEKGKGKGKKTAAAKAGRSSLSKASQDPQDQDSSSLSDDSESPATRMQSTSSLTAGDERVALELNKSMRYPSRSTRQTSKSLRR
ncbi:hypothetical protein JCM10212_000266 [Sporobolomyces blumeae]